MANKTLSDFPVLTNLDAASVTHVQKELVDYQVALNTLTQYVTENAEYTALGNKINGADEKTDPADADMVGLVDSAASNALKKFSWANFKAKLKTYFDALYPSANNFIINGSMDIAQRGTSFAAIASNGYSLDRWVYAKSGDMVHTITQDTDVPTGGIFTKSIKLDCTTADAAVDAGDYAMIFQRIEGNILKSLFNKTVTLSFWVKATKTGTYCIVIRDSAASYSYIAEYTISESDTWEYKTVTFTLETTSGTWNADYGQAGYISWVLMCGSTRPSTPGSWQSGNYVATSNQVNACDSTDNNFWLTGVMLNEGTVAAPFQPFGGNYISDFIACQRYYEKSYDIATVPGTNTYSGIKVRIASATAYVVGCDFAVRKRVATPTVALYSKVGTADKVSTMVPADIGTSVTANTAVTSESGFRLIVDSGSNFTAGAIYQYHYTADAEL